MASGDLASSTPVFCGTAAEIESAIDALNLAAATDRLCVIPWNNGALVWKVERTA